MIDLITLLATTVIGAGVLKLLYDYREAKLREKENENLEKEVGALIKQIQDADDIRANSLEGKK